MQKLITKFIGLAIILSLNQTSFAQNKKEKKDLIYANRVSILAGLIQPSILKGGNFEVTYFTKKFSFDYSHGFSLDIEGSTVTGDAKDQKLAYHLPYSTGFGIGYRISSNLDIRVEPKMHSWKVYYDGEKPVEANFINEYKTYTLGIGAYYRYFPFQKNDNWLKGLTTSTSLRWWPNVRSTLPNDKFTYQNKYTNKEETIKASNIGIAGSQTLFNISVGYTFGSK